MTPREEMAMIWLFAIVVTGLAVGIIALGGWLLGPVGAFVGMVLVLAGFVGGSIWAVGR